MDGLPSGRWQVSLCPCPDLLEFIIHAIHLSLFYCVQFRLVRDLDVDNFSALFFVSSRWTVPSSRSLHVCLTASRGQPIVWQDGFAFLRRISFPDPTCLRPSFSVSFPASLPPSSQLLTFNPEVILQVFPCTLTNVSLSATCRYDQADNAKSRCVLPYAWIASGIRFCLCLTLHFWIRKNLHIFQDTKGDFFLSCLAFRTCRDAV